MFVYSFVYFIACIITEFAASDENVALYLTNRSDFVSSSLKETRKIFGNGITVEMYDVQPLLLQKNYKHALAFSIFNVTHLLMDTNIYILNDNYKLQVSQSIDDEKNSQITFAKSIHHKSTGLVAFAFENGLLTIYGKTKNNTTLTFFHSIRMESCNNIHFFKEDSELFMAIASDTVALEANPSACRGICIFKWTGAHFDKVCEVATLNAVGVTSFHSEEGSILVVLGKKQPSTAFVFKDNALHKIQNLKTTNPSKVISYKIEENHLIAILDGSLYNTYFWNGVEFLLIESSKCTKINQIYLNPNTDYPTFFATRNSELIIYKPTLTGVILQNLTIDFHRNESNIFTIIPVFQNKDYALLLFESTPNTTVSVLPFSVYFNTTIGDQLPKKGGDDLLVCLKSLDSILEGNRKSISNNKRIEKYTKTKMQKPTGAANSESAIVGVALFGKARERLEELQNHFLEMQESTNEMQQRIKELANKAILGDASIKGNLIAQTLETAFLSNVKRLNNKTWNPNSWLFYQSNQIVTAPVFASTIVVKNLKTSLNDPIFKDLLHNSGTQILTGNNILLRLKASEIYCSVINEVPFETVYLKSQHKVIKGKKIFDSLRARNLTVTTLNKRPPYEILNALSDPKMYDFKFGSHLNIQNLTFTEINGVSWDKFSNSVFRQGKSSTITGNLNINQLSVENLNATVIDRVKVSDLFTKTTDQVVASTIHFENVSISENFNCTEMNGMDLQKEAINIIPGDVIIVKSPVSIKNLKSSKKLFINTSKPGFTSNAKESNPNCLQVYHEKVKIIGNVELNTVSFDQLAEVIVNGHPFQISMLRNYWLKNHFQKIPVHVTFQKEISVPNLIVRSLNNIDVGDYLVQNVDNEKTAHFYFENITVFGDVFLSSRSQHQPDLKAIERESVKYFGRYTVQGKKIFNDTVIIKHLKTTSLNNIDLSKAVNKNAHARITGKKLFENIVVVKDLEANGSMIHKINNVHLERLQNEALYIDEKASLPLVNFNDLKVQNLKVNQINDKPIHDFIIKRNHKQSNGTIASISLQGNITFNNATLRYINGIFVDHITMRVLNSTFVVPYNVHFPGNVRIRHLHATKINGVNIKNISKRLLYRNYEQVVTAPFTFDNITTDNLYAAKINNISLNHLIETDKLSNLVNPKNVKLNRVKYIKKLTAHLMSCNIEQAIHQLENPSRVKWRMVDVVGDLKILDKKSDIINILQNIVTTTSKNIITAPVIFVKNVFANIVITTGKISGVNVTKIAHDAIFSTVKGKPITVTGRNTFQVLKSAEVIIRGNANISKVNNILVRKVNSSIIYKNFKDVYTIRGKKTFLGGLETNNLYTERIAGLKPENLVNLKSLRVIPKATFDKLVVTGSMSIDRINDVKFDWFLNNRVLCKSEDLQTLQGTYYFVEMLINDSILTPRLNHLHVEDIVTDGNLQNIESEKTFLNDMTVNGNINLDLLNDVNLTRFYESAVFVVQNEAINGSLTIKSNSNVSSNLNVQTLNGVPIDRLKYILNFHDPEIVATSAGNTLQRIGTIVEESMRSLSFLPDKLMYIQEVTSLRASLPPSQDIRIVQLTQNSTMILLDGQTTGTFCDLPPNCPCPIEHIVFFGPGKIRINNNTNNRVFKYNEDDMFVSLTTRAASVSSYCRTNMSKIFNEFSQLSWKNSKTGLRGSRKISGYLSDAEFFNYNGRTYVVLCKYYDPVFDTHELYCTVFKSNEEANLEEIQDIPVTGSWKTHILYTAQGVVLIIGNVVPGISNYTDIYRFNPVGQKFEILRSVKTIGCTAAAGVVLETESLIILAQANTPVHILKYDSTFDNYYYYQSFPMDHPVVSVSVFYTGGFGISDAFLSVVTSNGAFSIYSFNEIEGWKLESSGEFEGLIDLIPIEMNKMSYLFAPSSTQTRLLAIVKQSYV